MTPELTLAPTAGTPPTGASDSAAGRSPQPRWVNPALAVVLVLAAVLYGWGLDRALLHPYYTAAVRSMATSWHAFLYGGLDPSGSITVDKLPGALWLQALSVRAFGLHVWAVALPQAVEGVLTVLVLFRVVRRWAGAVAGLLAALLLAVTPITAALDRGNISDTLLTLLLVLAAGAALQAVRTGRLVPLLLCALWVGLAFQAKMLQAWLLLPVFGAVYLLAAPGGIGRRVRNLAVSGFAALAVSCSWMLLVLTTPASQRPYLDGTTGNNPFALVFGYNGFSRYSTTTAGSSGAGSSFGSVAGTAASRPVGGSGWGFVFDHTVGPQISWFVPLAVLALALGLWQARGKGRTDPTRAGHLLWGGWFLINYLAFATAGGIHGYYTVVLAPACAALAAGGLTTCWNFARTSQRWRQALTGSLLLTVGWAVLLDSRTPHFRPWTVPLAGLLGLAASGVYALAGRTEPRSGGRRAHGRNPGNPLLALAVAVGLAAVVLSPAVWSFSVLQPRYAGIATSPLAGPVGAAYTSRTTVSSQPVIGFGPAAGRPGKMLAYLRSHRGGSSYLAAVQSALLAEPLLRADPEPLLVMNGFTGNTPFPSAPALTSLVRQGKVRYVILTTQRAASDATRWTRAHCAKVAPSQYGEPTDVQTSLWDCRNHGG